MSPTFIRIGQIVISWASVLFLPKKTFIRYSAPAIFASSLVLIVSFLAIPLKLWRVNGGIKTKIFNDLSFIFGPFFMGTIWIFRLTYGKFGLYMLGNLIMNSFLAFPLSSIYQKLKVYKLINFKRKYLLLTYITFAILIYGYQVVLDKAEK